MHLQSFATLRDSVADIVVPDGAALRLVNLALDQQARAAGARSWRPPPARTLPALIAQRFERARLAGRGPAAEFLLSPEQELALWQQAVAADETLAIGSPEVAAGAARAAWRTLHAWCLPWPPAALQVNDDIAAFQRWSASYLERCRALRVTDHARLLADEALAPLADVLAHGFLAPAPTVARLLPAAPPAVAGDPRRFAPRAYADREQEVHAALAWARAQAQPGARVVVALDSLREDADLVRRAVREVWGEADAVHVATRAPLAADPRIALALRILDFAPVMPWQDWSALLRSPLLAGAADERGARARADLALRALDRHELPLAVVRNTLSREGHPCARLVAVLDALRDLQSARPRRQSLVGWLEHFERLLSAAGWPGDGALDADTLRLQRDWGEVCDRLQRLDAVLPAHDARAALARLRRLLQDSASATPPAADGIFVVTPEEATLLAPTALWLAGAESAAFVGQARPSPCLPLGAQREAGVPGADPPRDLARARALIAALAGGDGPRIASCRKGDGELVYSPSPLLPGLHGVAAAAPARLVPLTWRQAPATLAAVEDRAGTVPGTELRGGVGVLAAQAACPFRAYARHRLRARAPDEPRPGMSPLAKGNAAHEALATLWRELGDQAALRALDAGQRAARVAAAVAHALPPPPGATPLEHAVLDIELARLAALLDQWLALELARAPFSVVAVEAPRVVRFGGFEFNVRVDRIDRDADGRETVIDYKTGACAAKDWLPPRMDQPQLPFYALADDTARIGGLAYARLDAVQPQWIAGPAPEDWDAACAAWRADLDALAAEIAAGLATVAPKKGAATCRNCEFTLLCRIREVARLLDEDGGEEEGGDDGA